MGAGSSVVWPRDTSPDELLRRAVSEGQQASYQSELNLYLQDLLAELNSRDTDKVNTHLQTIKNALSQEISESIELLYGGSIRKHTYVDGLSDIDVLVIIDNSALANEPPRRVVEYFADLIRQRLPGTPVKTGALAVTLTFSDGYEIQVLPALTTKTGIRIAASDGAEWSNVIRPERFADKLTRVNQANNSGVVPVIKLYKVMNSQLPEDVRLKGYHIESLAIEAFEDYKGPRTRKDMLQHLAGYASEAVLEPVKDSTGQSIRVDDKLGDANSFERKKIAASIKRIVSRMKLADSEASIARWKELMGDV